MRNKLVTVFGGAGFVGRHTIRRLAEAGATVRVATRSPSLAGFLRPMGDVGQIVPAAWNPDDPASVAALLDGADMAINLVGILYESRSGDFDRVQGRLPGLIGQAAAAKGVRHLVHNSAIGADPAGKSLYARSKGIGEQAMLAAYPGATILRPSIIVGPDDGFFNRFAAMAKISPFLPLIGGGHTRFQPVFVGDVAAAIMAALTGVASPGATYELGGPSIYSFAELMRWMLKILERRRILLPVPFGVAAKLARVMELSPWPPLTRDQVLLLQSDNVVAEGARNLHDLRIEATPIELVVPAYLRAFGKASMRANPA